MEINIVYVWYPREMYVVLLHAACVRLRFYNAVFSDLPAHDYVAVPWIRTVNHTASFPPTHRFFA